MKRCTRIVHGLTVGLCSLFVCQAANALVATVSQRINPALTGAGINNSTYSGQHYVVEPAAQRERKHVLVLFLGGSLSNPSDYNGISDRVAGNGFGVLDLGYINNSTLKSACNSNDACYTQVRGEIIFGDDVAYTPGGTAYHSSRLLSNTDPANSIVNRLVSILDYLGYRQHPNAQNPDPTYWREFLVPNPSSPYVGRSLGRAYPDWSKIIVAGHSQGGGHAAFLAMNLPTTVRRVVMLSAPEDTATGDSPASWITGRSSTALTSFWGLRNASPTGEAQYGRNVHKNWQVTGGTGRGGVGGTSQARDRLIGTGVGNPLGAHRLATTLPNSSAVQNHDSTALDGAYLPGIVTAWDYLFTGDGAD